ncbi:hypothetical protein DSLASN_33280 [Desulfoluna limicola]|uniref:Uncharacterized protein n=1 Tax=Desulfoluna limicola TaxID=2810562 RepID=A0ABN6F7J0_9BACT|nr:hypothetical protein [Desulfoluna limicola]BCS97696.1 hypothetical protein DSLASN_33280 [Desulfoluna limicola]
MRSSSKHRLVKVIIGRLYNFNDRRLLHPMAVHIPNGMVPVAGLFMALGCLFNVQSLVMAAYLNLWVIFLAMPGVMMTGTASWKHRYKGIKTPLFRTKIGCSILVLLMPGIILCFQTINPVHVDNLTASDWGVTGAYLALLIPTARAGALGGRLVFGGRKKLQ